MDSNPNRLNILRTHQELPAKLRHKTGNHGGHVPRHSKCCLQLPASLKKETMEQN